MQETLTIKLNQMMNKCKTDIIFPSYMIPTLATLRGENWSYSLKGSSMNPIIQ